MCGIAGVVARSASAANDVLRVLAECQTHRGPDDVGQCIIEFGSSVAGFAHRRLSIIDLSPLGHQPMVDPSTGDVLVFNGEIYNYLDLRAELVREGYTFKGRSDTEVILAALTRGGVGAISRLEGMFAFGWLRRHDRKLVLARDAAGIKPLYVAWKPEGLAFASEVRPLLAAGAASRRINPRALLGLLAFGAVQDPDTFFDGIQSFPAGCWQEIDVESVLSKKPASPVRFWAPPAPDASITLEEAVERTRNLVAASVRDHLIADVEVGVFLSSGIDSTVIAGLAARCHPGIRSYTVGFRDAPDMSESDGAAQTAKVLGLSHVDVQITTSDARESAIRWLASMDQPSMDGLNTFVVAEAVRQTGLKVALSGLGGDELFGGYPTFYDVPRLQRTMRAARHIPAPIRGLIARAASIGKSVAFRQKLVEIARTEGRLLELYLQRRRTMSLQQIRALGLEPERYGLGPTLLSPDALLGIELDERFPVPGISALEMRLYAGNMLLRDSDANGMAHGLEIRVPLFDKRLLDGIMPIPGPARLPSGIPNKHLLRAAFPDLLRPELLARKKQGFTLPISRWMVTSLRSFCEASLSDLKGTGLVDPRGVDTLWKQFLEQPQSQLWSRLFTLCVIGDYIRRNNASITGSPASGTRGGAASTPTAEPRLLRIV